MLTVGEGVAEAPIVGGCLTLLCASIGTPAFFAAAYEAAHEAVLNCLVAARPGTRLDGSVQDAFPLHEM